MPSTPASTLPRTPVAGKVPHHGSQQLTILGLKDQRDRCTQEPGSVPESSLGVCPGLSASSWPERHSIAGETQCELRNQPWGPGGRVPPHHAAAKSTSQLGAGWVGTLSLVTGRTVLSSGPGMGSDHALARAPVDSLQRESGKRSALWR